MRLNISRKLFLSYLAMAILTIVSSLYAVFNLRDITACTTKIIRGDVIVIENSKLFIDNLIDRESSFKKFIILKDKSFEDIFAAKSKEFRTKLAEMKQTDGASFHGTIDRIEILNQEYEKLFFDAQEIVQSEKSINASEEVLFKIKPLVEAITTEIRKIQKISEDDVDRQMSAINTIGLRTINVTLLLSLFSLIFGIGLTIFITYSISRPLKRLEKAAVLVGRGEFEHSLSASGNDEIGSLTEAFGKMVDKLKVLEAINLDASPLTGLPGNLAIEREVEKRIADGVSFALCHVDLDNFKPFVDKYGYAWGSEIIKEVANILTNRIGNSEEDAFIGHIGGDDFVIVAMPEQAEKMSQQLVEEFAPSLESFYSEQDRTQGFIIGKDRKGLVHKFPLITVTVAIVTNHDMLNPNPLTMAKRAAQVKEYGKTMSGSNFVKVNDYQQAHPEMRKNEKT